MRPSDLLDLLLWIAAVLLFLLGCLSRQLRVDARVDALRQRGDPPGQIATATPHIERGPTSQVGSEP